MSMSCLDCHGFMYGYNRGKREGTIEELNKIKTEIEKLEYDDFDCNLVLPAWEVYNLIDNYIEKLKGGK